MRFWSLNTLRSSVRQGSVSHSYIGRGPPVLMTSGLRLTPPPPDPRAHVGISPGFPRGVGFLGNPPPPRQVADAYLDGCFRPPAESRGGVPSFRPPVIRWR